MSTQASFAAFAYGKYQVDLWSQTFPLANIPWTLKRAMAENSDDCSYAILAE
jgi:hypothetical protein